MKPGLMPTSDLELAGVIGVGEILVPLMPLSVQWRGSQLPQGSLDVLLFYILYFSYFSGRTEPLTLKLPHKHCQSIFLSPLSL